MHPPHLKNEGQNIKTNTKEEENSNADSAPASLLSKFLLAKIQKQKPNFTGQVIPKWIKDSEKLLKTRSPDELRKVMDWLYEDAFWSGVVMSPGNLLKNLDKIEMQMMKSNAPKKQSPVAVEEENRKLAERVGKKYPDHRDITIGDTYIEFNLGAMNRPHLKFTDLGFKEQLLHNLRKMRLTIEEAFQNAVILA